MTRLGRVCACLAVGAFVIGMVGCQYPAPSGGGLSGVQSISMTLPKVKMDGKVGDTQYEVFELAPAKQTITARSVTLSATIADAPFVVAAPTAKPAYCAAVLIHEAARGNNLADANGAQAFQAALKELFAKHKKDVGGVQVSMNGKALDL